MIHDIETIRKISEEGYKKAKEETRYHINTMMVFAAKEGERKISIPWDKFNTRAMGEIAEELKEKGYSISTNFRTMEVLW